MINTKDTLYVFLHSSLIDFKIHSLLHLKIADSHVIIMKTMANLVHFPTFLWTYVCNCGLLNINK